MSGTMNGTKPDSAPGIFHNNLRKGCRQLFVVS